MNAPALTALMFGVAAFAAGLSGFLSLSLAMERHWVRIHAPGAQPRPGLRRLLQGLGATALLVSLLCCAAVHDSGPAFIAWIGFMTASAWLAVGLVAYGESQAGRAARMAAALTVVAAVTALVLRLA